MKKIFLPAFLAAATLANAQTYPHPDSDHPDILALDTLVVSAGPDAKSAFDLAQGTAVLLGNQLRRQAASTLGATLATTPGVNATYYGPGSSRPVIRGLGGDRVRMLDNGIGSLDASNVSPDHNVAVEPLLVERIEVLRGPATLLYGSSAVGGGVCAVATILPTLVTIFVSMSSRRRETSAMTFLFSSSFSESAVIFVSTEFIFSDKSAWLRWSSLSLSCSWFMSSRSSTISLDVARQP